MRVAVRMVAVAALLFAAWQFGAALTIHAKAWLGQVLLRRAWHASVAAQVPVRPWPWADLAPLVRLRLPDLNLERLVLEGLSGQTLAWGPGMVVGRGHRVIAGHRDTHFRFLQDLRPGYRLELEGLDGAIQYWQVVASAVVDARHAELDMMLDAEQLTLVTCYPFDAAAANGPLRYVVSLVRAPNPPDQLLQFAR